MIKKYLINQEKNSDSFKKNILEDPQVSEKQINENFRDFILELRYIRSIGKNNSNISLVEILDKGDEEELERTGALIP